MSDELKINISLEDIVNQIRDHHPEFTKEDLSNMYMQMAGFKPEWGEVSFDEKGYVDGWKPNKPIEYVKLKVTIDPEKGTVNVD